MGRERERARWHHCVCLLLFKRQRERDMNSQCQLTVRRPAALGCRRLGIARENRRHLVLARDQKKPGLFDWWQSSDENTSRFGKKARDDMYEEQLKILEGRRNKDKSQERAEEVKERRTKVSRLMKGIDKPERKKFEGYDEPKNSIPIPLNPIGMPEYDGGERFDLKAPYCDEGYVDEDADIMKKLFGGIFKKKE